MPAINAVGITHSTSCHSPYLLVSLSLSPSLSCLLSPSVTPYLYPHLHHHCACPWAVTVIVSASGAVTRATNSIEYCTAYCAFPLHKIKAQFPPPPPPHNLSPLSLFSSFTYRRGGGGTTICLWHSNLLSLARDRGASARLNIPWPYAACICIVPTN